MVIKDIGEPELEPTCNEYTVPLVWPQDQNPALLTAHVENILDSLRFTLLHELPLYWLRDNESYIAIRFHTQP